MKLEETSLQVIRFGDAPDDTFYCLVDRNVSPDGLNLEKMRLTDPRNFDRQFHDVGCLAMITGLELDELVRRGDVDRETLHEDLFKVCRQEGIID